MTQHRPIELLLSRSDARALFDWLTDSGEIAFLTHATGSAGANRGLLLEATRLLKAGLDDADKLKLYNETLLAQRWCAFRSVEPCAQAYLLWHIPSGPVEIESIKMRGPRYIEVPDPFTGWSGPGSGELPTTSPQPCFIDMFLEFVDDPGRAEGVTLLQQSHARNIAAPASLRNFWSRLKRYAKANLRPAARPPARHSGAGVEV